MKSRDTLKTLGMLGVAFGLTTTPLAFADFHDGEAEDPAAQTQPVTPADPATPADPGVPGDPAAPATPAYPADDPAIPEETVPDDEPGFGGGTEPMPSGEDATDEEWPTSDDEVGQDDAW